MIRRAENITDGYPITMVLPKESAGNELEGNALAASSKNKPRPGDFLTVP